MEVILQKYEKAVQLFEQGCYDEAVELFIDVYNQDVMKEEIISNLYACFVTPNYKEFEDTYNKNKDDSFVDYEELPIDFIPVNENKFYLFDKKEGEFLGNIVLKKRYPENREKEIDSLLITNVWDLREMLDVMYLKRWEHIYIIPGEQKEYFMSFYKLSGITKLYLKNTTFFAQEDILEEYFVTKPNVYLPRTIVGEETEYYREIIAHIHHGRVHDLCSKKDNILLSICIPTFERGDKALKNVQTILKSQYDAEIEVVVSNNGSVNNSEGYEKIKEIKDSRLVYFSYEENQGFTRNIMNVLALARGKFAVLDSDEDVLIIQNLDKYLKILKNHKDAGVVLSSGYGDNFSNKTFAQKTGYEAFVAGLNTNYITGITYNNDIIKKEGYLKKCEELFDNLFFEYYPHIAMSVMLCEKNSAVETDVMLWDAREDINCNIPEKELPLKGYMHPDIRIKQQNACLEMVKKITDLSPETFSNVIYERVWKTFFLVELACTFRTKAFCEEYDWLNVCLMLYRNNNELIKVYESYLGQDLAMAVKLCCDNVFLEEIVKNPAKSIQSEKESTRQMILAYLLKYYHQTERNIEDVDIDKIAEWVEKGGDEI